MNADMVKGRWKEIKGMLKKQWEKFNEDDMERARNNSYNLKNHIL